MAHVSFWQINGSAGIQMAWDLSMYAKSWGGGSIHALWSAFTFCGFSLTEFNDSFFAVLVHLTFSMRMLNMWR